MSKVLIFKVPIITDMLYTIEVSDEVAATYKEGDQIRKDIHPSRLEFWSEFWSEESGETIYHDATVYEIMEEDDFR